VVPREPFRGPYRGARGLRLRNPDLGFPAPGDKVSLDAPTQPFRGSIDAKSELGVKGRRELTGALLIIVSRPVCKLHTTVTSQNWCQDLGNH